jgi:hypothetical protein
MIETHRAGFPTMSNAATRTIKMAVTSCAALQMDRNRGFMPFPFVMVCLFDFGSVLDEKQLEDGSVASVFVLTVAAH